MTGDRAKLSYAVLIMLALVSISSAQPPQTDIYFAKEIWNGTDQPIQDGAMLVVDGKIEAIGPRAEVSIPPAANRHELGSQVIIPGLIAVQTNLSGTQTEERTLTPSNRAIDGFDFFADRNRLLESGLTTAQISPGASRLMPGTGGVVQLAGEDLVARILNEQESLRIVLSTSSRNPPRIYEPEVGPVSQDRPLMETRPQLATLSASLAGLRQIFKQATAKETFVSQDVRDELIVTVAELLEQEIPVRITAKTAPEIRGAVELAKEFNLKIILDDCEGLTPFLSQLESWKGHVQGVVLSGNTPGQITNPTSSQLKTQTNTWEFARELMDAGIPVAIRTRNDADLLQTFFVAGQFMKDGLSQVELLSAITSTPAKMMNVADHVGSLAKGKRADFVVLNGQPFKLHSRVQATYVSGVSQFQRERAATTTVVNASRVYLGDGKFLDDASVVVKGATVRGIGSGVSAPAEANVRTYDGAVIVPGFIDMGAGLGVGAPLRGNITLQTKLGEQLYADDPAIRFARQNGITTALLSGTGPATPVVAFKLGDDARVISDPIAIRFRLTGDTASGIAANERLLKAGKAYVDSWSKYEKDLAEYKVKLKEWEAKNKTTKGKAEPKKVKAETPKKEDSKKEKPEADKKTTEVKKEADKKEGEKDQEKPKKEVPNDPITGTWEGTIDTERLPAPLRNFTFELELDGETITGTVEMLRATTEISEGSFNRESREIMFKIERRGTELEITGSLDADDNLTGSIELGRLGKVDLTGSRTVDKSKKPEPDKETPEKKEKPAEGKDKPADKEEKPAEDKKKDAESTAGKDEKSSSSDEKKEPEPKPAATEKKETAPKEPKKPRENAALEPYRALFSGKIPAMVESRDLNSIKATAELFSVKYKLRTIIVGANDLARQPDLLDGYSVSVCTGPNLSVTIDKQPTTNLPQLLSNEQLAFGFQSSGTTGSGLLPGAVQFSVSQGLSTTDALDGLTSDPAMMLSDDLNFGKLATGKDADLVVLSGSPFEYSTKVLAVMIDGVWVYEREEQK